MNTNRPIRIAVRTLFASLLLATLPTLASAEVQREPATEALLLQARLALGEGHLLEPAGGNAFELYLRAREVSPNDTRPHEALNDLFPLTKDAIDGAIARGEYNEARRMIELVDRAMPGSLTVSNLRSRLEQRAPSIASTR